MTGAAIVVLLCSAHTVISISRIVRTDDLNTDNTSMTFNEYANSAEIYFVSNTVFNFVKGNHFLNTTLALNKCSNLTLIGSDSKIFLCTGCSLIVTNTFHLFIRHLNIFFSVTDKNSKLSAISFKNSHFILFINVSFTRELIYRQNRSRALLIESNSTITITGCSFENGYHSLGGAMSIRNSWVNFLSNFFRYNLASLQGGVIFSKDSTLIFNGTNFFERNTAGKVNSTLFSGSAIATHSTNTSFNGLTKFIGNEYYFYSSPHRRGGTIAAYYSELIMIGETLFENNLNRYGGAIFLEISKFIISGKITFINNTATHSGGAIFASESSLIIQATYLVYSSISLQQACSGNFNEAVVLFCSNKAGELGGAIHAEKSNVTISGSMYFAFNKAQNGGAISLMFTSESGHVKNSFFFQIPMYTEFTNNSAKRSGGAMYIDDIYTDTRLCEYLKYHEYVIPCFFKLRYEFLVSAQLNLTNNLASSGTGFYGGALQYCKVAGAQTPMNGFQILQRLFRTNDNFQNLYASSSTIEVRYCGEYKDRFVQDRHVSISIQRGQTFNISVIVLGEFDIAVEERAAFSLSSSIPEHSSQLFSEPYNYAKIQGCRNLGFRILSKGIIETLSVYPPQCNLEVASLFVKLNLMDCLPGFVLENNACECDNSILQVTGHKDLCNTTAGLIKCPKFDWMKPLFNNNNGYMGLMWSPDCPPRLCNTSTADIWLNFSSFSDDVLCKENRMGIVCGSCSYNNSLLLNSLSCSKCSGQKYLSLLILFIAAGITVIILLLSSRLTIATGTLNGLILYANVLNICQDLIIPNDRANAIPLKLIFSWLNLDFGISTCFYDGLDSYSYIWLQFVFPFYLWFLVGCIIIICKLSPKAVKILGSNPVAVLATVILLSYTKLLYNSQEILSYVKVLYSEGSQEYRWRTDPNIFYFQTKHIPLALFAIVVVTVFLIPYTFLLTFGYCLQSFSQKKGLRWINTFKPILDTYYAPYSKASRYWIGLLLFVRVFISISYSILKNNERATILIIISSVFSGIAIFPWLRGKIYDKILANIFEASFILNIIVLSIVSYPIRRAKVSYRLILFNISTSAAFLTFIIIIVTHLCIKFKLDLYYKKLRQYYYSKKHLQHGQSNAKDLQTTEEKKLCTLVTTDLREPLLENSITQL